MNKNTLTITEGTIILYDVRHYITDVVIPTGVTEIGYESFKNCSNLKSINIPNSVIYIGDDAFSHCSSLTEIIIPNSVTEIGNYCFYNCSSLNSIYIDKEKDSLDLSKTGIKVYWRGEWEKEK